MMNKRERSVVRSTAFCLQYLLNDERKHETAILTLFKVSSSAHAGVNSKSAHGIVCTFDKPAAFLSCLTVFFVPFNGYLLSFPV